MVEHGGASSPAGRPRPEPPVRAVRVRVDPASVRQEWLFLLLAVLVLCARCCCEWNQVKGSFFRWCTGRCR